VNVVSRAPSILLVGLVVAATALLVTGYGVAVGIGVIVGALLGAAWIAALLVMNPRTRGGSSYFFGTARRSPNEPDHEAIQRYHMEWMRVAGVDMSPLRRVIAVGTSVEVAGARVELMALELREDGGVASVVSHTRPPTGPVGHFILVTVSDDAGTAYVGSGQTSGGSGMGTNRHDVRFAPTPPDDARALTIRIESFVAPYPGPAVQLDGPWEFRIAL
jgi:hypothetical protein